MALLNKTASKLRLLNILRTSDSRGRFLLTAAQLKALGTRALVGRLVGVGDFALAFAVAAHCDVEEGRAAQGWRDAPRTLRDAVLLVHFRKRCVVAAIETSKSKHSERGGRHSPTDEGLPQSLLLAVSHLFDQGLQRWSAAALIADEAFPASIDASVALSPLAQLLLDREGEFYQSFGDCVFSSPLSSNVLVFIPIMNKVRTIASLMRCSISLTSVASKRPPPLPLRPLQQHARPRSATPLPLAQRPTPPRTLRHSPQCCVTAWR